jgi:NADPH-dependent 2,4-dienoyl-CoA reductase/sulfur reductase-like enzyme
VVCDEIGRTSRPGVFAAGDVAAWSDHVTGTPHRHEHWTAAREQSRIVAQQIVGAPETAWQAFVPYFWSDIHGKRVQLLGNAADATDVAFVFENPETSAFVAEYRRDGRLIGVAGLNAAARVMRYAGQLAN